MLPGICARLLCRLASRLQSRRMLTFCSTELQPAFKISGIDPGAQMHGYECQRLRMRLLRMQRQLSPVAPPTHTNVPRFFDEDEADDQTP